MPSSTDILHPEAHHAHRVAQATLCVLAGVCISGVLVAWWQRPAHRLPVAGEVHAQLPGQAAANPVLPAPPPVTNAALPLIPSPSGQAIAALPTPSMPALGPGPAPDTATRPVLPPGKQLKNPQVIEAVEVAREVRKLGNMVAALESLRAADLREPNHPEILAEMALTYEAMGIQSKATAAWKEVLGLGEAAGGYAALAKGKLEPSGASAPELAGSPVSLGACQVIRDPSVKQGERIAVRVPVIGSPGATIDPTQMDIHVFLFESVNNGERIEQVRAGAPTLNWVSTPVDWREAREELLDVVYDLAPPKPEEVRDLGRRSFHGYIVKLFYQNKLVGEQQQPASLRDEAQKRPSPAGLDNALFPQ